MSLPKPRSPAPALEVDVVGEGRWRLAEQAPKTFTMIVFYRGYHCPICKLQLRDLDRRIDDFAARGVDVIAVSGDSDERATRTKQEWELARLRVGYGLREPAMRAWGLFVSRGIKDTEPALFNEPGLFLIRPDHTVYWLTVSSMPFVRPDMGAVLQAIDFVTEHDYPARGEA